MLLLEFYLFKLVCLFVCCSAERIDSGDVLSDIDNMLQDLTDELDAMLDLEVT